MRDAIQLEGLVLVKENVEHKVVGFFSTQLDKTYIKIQECKSKSTVNYEFSTLGKFLKKYGFLPKPLIFN